MKLVEQPAPAELGFHIPSLDGIRAVAVTIVFLSHAGLGDVVPGGFGVTVFFFLSGYLITTLLRREYETSQTIRLKSFYLRRFYRIFPPLYLVLGILILLQISGVIRQPMSAGAVLAQLLNLTNYYLLLFPTVEQAPIVPYTVQMWSLAVEEHFYLLFPLALLLLLRRVPYGRIAIMLGVTCGVVLVWRAILVATLENPAHHTYHATDTRIDSLLFGCILALWLNPALDPAPAGIGRRGWLALCTAAIAVLLGGFLYRAEDFRESLRYTLQGIALFPLFYCAVRYAGSPLFAWLNSAPLRALGLVSYTFYLSHLAVIELTGQLFGLEGLGRGVAAFGAAAAFSAASYLLLERRMARLRRRLHRAKETRGQRSMPEGGAVV